MKNIDVKRTKQVIHASIERLASNPEDSTLIPDILGFMMDLIEDLESKLEIQERGGK